MDIKKVRHKQQINPSLCKANMGDIWRTLDLCSWNSHSTEQRGRDPWLLLRANSCTGPGMGILFDSQALTESRGNPDTAGTV